ncbi:MAG: thioredoxin-like domain-containing protein, partial [Acidobacteriota bacterium]
MHVFPQLRKLEQKYAAELSVVGVHSAKFTAEKDTHNVRKAVLRYEIDHPVVNDDDFLVWQQYAVRAWPTLMFIDPEGRVVAKHEGEIALDALDRLIGEMVEEYDSQGLIDRRPLRFKLEREKELERPLSFPGKVLADEAGRRLVISDSNHHRILMASLDGEVTDIVGTGDKGLSDGRFGEASFNDPQGAALDGDRLYVADTKNHALRL